MIQRHGNTLKHAQENTQRSEASENVRDHERTRGETIETKQEPEKARVSLFPLLPLFVFSFFISSASRGSLRSPRSTRTHEITGQHQHKTTPTAYNSATQYSTEHDTKAPAKQQQQLLSTQHAAHGTQHRAHRAHTPHSVQHRTPSTRHTAQSTQRTSRSTQRRAHSAKRTAQSKHHRTHSTEHTSHSRAQHRAQRRADSTQHTSHFTAHSTQHKAESTQHTSQSFFPFSSQAYRETSVARITDHRPTPTQKLPP